VVGVEDATTGQAVAAFVIPSDEAIDRAEEDPAYWTALEADLSQVLREHVATAIGPIAKPRDVVVVPDLPKTRSGKIMRRLLGDIRDGRALGDVTSLQDDTVPERIARIVAARG
jgi:acetyl-CoA synthetase